MPRPKKNNAEVIDTFWPLPPIHDLIHKVKKSKFYISIDLAQGYNQMRVADSCTHKLAFTIKNKRFEFCRLPFGLISASYAFSRMLETILDELLVDQGIHLYLDDILITGDSEDEMAIKFKKILQKVPRKFKSSQFQ